MASPIQAITSVLFGGLAGSLFGGDKKIEQQAAAPTPTAPASQAQTEQPAQQPNTPAGGEFNVSGGKRKPGGAASTFIGSSAVPPAGYGQKSLLGQ